MAKKLHPEGVASLIAVILAPDGEDYEKKVDQYREMVLELADQYYKCHDQDYFEGPIRSDGGTKNLAKLGRANLR